MRNLTLTLTLTSLLLTTGCDPTDDGRVGPSWEANQSFVVETSRRMSAMATEEVPTMDLDGRVIAADPVGDVWTEPAYWTYQVIHSGFEPDAGHELRPYYELDGRPSTLTVLRAHLDSSLNWGHPLLEADPKVYLVVREGRGRLAAVVSFYTANGDRKRDAYDLPSTARSTNLLSQSDLVAAPTYLPPFPLRDADEVVVLENGHRMHSSTTDDGAVDVIFEDEVDGNLVHQRWFDGEPFARETVTPNLQARLLGDAEVNALEGMAPRFDGPEPGSEDWDFLAALAESVNLQASLSILAEDLGETTAQAVEGYRPWAGSWWPQADGELVFGYDGRATYSDQIHGTVDPIAAEMDFIQDELREMDRSSDEYKEKVELYKEKQKALVDALVEFYGGMLTGLDGGQIVVADGKISKGDEWSYSLDSLSPMDKFALYEYAQGHTSPNPFYLPAWELLNHYSPAGGSWWGHCNGWAAAAILTNEPREELPTTMLGEGVDFTTADLKGLVTEAYYSQHSHFYGERYNGEEQEIADLYPDAFHRIIGFYIRDRGVPLVFDTSADEQVWNYPAWGYDMDMEETTDEAQAALVNLNTADRDALIELPEIGEAKADLIIDHRLNVGPFQSVEEVMDIDGIGEGTYGAIMELVTVEAIQRTFLVSIDLTFTTDGVSETHLDGASPQGFDKSYRYTLTADDQGLVSGGYWEHDDKHPDFAWVPYHNPRYPSNNGSENPYLHFGHLADMMGEDAIRH